MNLGKIDLNLFLIFEAIYREGSVTKVANILNLTQPAISNALSRLRTTFDDPLFVRTPSGMVPTPLADSVISDVRKALSLFEKSINAETHFDAAQSARLFDLAMGEFSSYLLLPKLRQEIENAAPGIRINNYYASRDSAIEDLKTGKVDLLLDSPAFNAKEFEQRVLGKIPYVVAISKNHPLSAKRLTLKGYLECDHIHVSSRKKGSGQMDAALHSMGKKRQVAMRLTSYLTAANIVANSQLAWTLPEPLFHDIAEFHPLVIKKLPFDVNPMVMSLFWRKQANEDPAIKWLVETMTNLYEATF